MIESNQVLMRVRNYAAGLVICFLWFGPGVGLAADHSKSGNPRPEEGSLFGDSGNTNSNTSKHEDAKELESSDPARDAFASGEVTDNPLQIGGIYYHRMIISPQQGGSLGSAPMSAPLQFDGFMDARPNDRVRGFVDARLLYDPTRDAYSNSTAGNSLGSTQNSSTSTAPTSAFSSGNTLIPNNPQVVLDQAWLKFDIDRTVFVTAGKQHVKWGPSRYWNPTDFLNTQRRDPLLPYDLRLGNSMLKLNVPWEAKKTNFYAVSLFDNPVPASSLGQLGEAFRLESVFGSTEVGIDTVFKTGRGPAYGLDVSAPLGPFDIYLESACNSIAPYPSYQVSGGLTAGADLSSLYTTVPQQGPLFQVSGGINYSFAWTENRQSTIGLEYFYNQLGYTNPNVYPVLIFLGQYQPFYTGRQYAAVYLTAEGPDAQKHTSYTFSTLGNLSDMSFISRVDFTWRILTYLSFESYFDVHYGTQGGEFNFSLSTPAMTYQGTSIAALNLASTLFDVGMALRVSF